MTMYIFLTILGIPVNLDALRKTLATKPRYIYALINQSKL